MSKRSSYQSFSLCLPLSLLPSFEAWISPHTYRFVAQLTSKAQLLCESDPTFLLSMPPFLSLSLIHHLYLYLPPARLPSLISWAFSAYIVSPRPPSPVPILQETCSHQHSTLAFHCLVRSRSQSSFPSNVNRRRGSNSVEPQPQSLRRPLASARLLLPSVLPWCRSFHTASLRLGCQQHGTLVQGCKEARSLLRPSVQIA